MPDYCEHPLAKQPTQKLLGFGVHRKVRIAKILILPDQISNVVELSIALGRLPSCDHFADFPQANILIVKPVPNGVVANGCSDCMKFLFQTRRRQVSKYNLRIIGITGSPSFQQAFQVFFDITLGGNFFFAPLPAAEFVPLQDPPAALQALSFLG